MEITATWSAREVVITIADDGPGIPPLVLDALGEPYITTRPSRRAGQGADGEPSGMGLGFFIAKTLLERSGATVALENRQAPSQRRHRQGELAAGGVRGPPSRHEPLRRLAEARGTPWPTGSWLRSNSGSKAWVRATARYAIVYGLRRH